MEILSHARKETHHVCARARRPEKRCDEGCRPHQPPPMLRACTSISASCSIGDAACQHFGGSSDAYDLHRTAAFAASGFLVLGPISYGILSSAAAFIPGSSTMVIAKRVLAIQCAEPFRLGFFLPMTVLLQGQPLDAAVAKARDETPHATVKSWLVFTMPLFVSFRYMRPENRVPLLSCIGACWNTYLSYIANRRGTDLLQS